MIVQRNWMLHSIHAAFKYLLSFLKTDWQLSDYPVRLRHHKSSLHSIGLDDSPWSAQVINWWQIQGFGKTRKEAYQDLQARFDEIKIEEKPLPRPGTHVPLQFASAVEIDQFERIAREFLQEILELNYDECFITDESTLYDFAIGYSCTTADTDKPLSPDDIMQYIRQQVQQVYDVDILSLADSRLITIFRAILAAHGFA